MMAGLSVIILAFLVAGANAGSYLITSPAKLYRGSVYNINVNILNTTGVEVAASLIYSQWNGTTNKRDTGIASTASGTFGNLENGAGTLSIPVPMDFHCPSCNLLIRGMGGLQFERKMHIDINFKSLSVMIQTDKAIYKPGQMVRYRVFAVYPDLKIYYGEMNIEIHDAKGNAVQMRKNVPSSFNGVIEGSLLLSEQPVFGQWKIRARMQETVDDTTQLFQVADYQLPRFEVTVELPPYGLTSDTKLSGTVKAKYTFGKPVVGMVELHFGPNTGPDYCGKAPKTVEIAMPISGEAKFEMPHSDIERTASIYNHAEVRVTAFVKEESTGIRLNGSNTIEFHGNEYNVEFLQNTASVFKPGLPYKAFIRVYSPDDLPPKGDDNVIAVYTTVSYSLTVADQKLYDNAEFTGTYPLPGQNHTLPANGVLEVLLDIPNNATKITMKATFKDQVTRREVEKTYSKSKTYIQLAAMGKNIKANTKTTFNLLATEPLGIVTYEILSRGTTALKGTVDGKGETTVDFDVFVTPAMAPTGHLLAYYTRETEEVVADSLAFSVDGIFENEVSIAFDEEQSEPHATTSLALTADANSTVFLLAVDQSVLLLKTGNDITSEKVKDAVSDFDLGESPDSPDYALSYSASSAQEVFTKTGLKVFTDLDIHKPSPRRDHRRNRLRTQMAVEDFRHDAVPSALGKVGPLAVSVKERVRSVFPEAWLWGEVGVGADGKASTSVTVPDTITSWVASAFATNPLSGLGVAPSTSKLRVFKPFFVSLTYPNSVTRGEQVVIQATVFNYLPTDVNVVVKLEGSPKFLFILSNGTEIPNMMAKAEEIHIKSEEQGVVYFPVLASNIGVADIKVIAQSNQAMDAVLRQMYVKAEGAPVSFNFPMFIKSDGTELSESISFPLPPDTVKGSAKARVKVTGDLIGSSLNNLEALLTLPTGCGEQSMVKFAPNLYIYQYLKSTGQLTEYLENKILRLLESGYQRQMTYQRSDGGFSAFGDRDEAGSMWLTAHVAKTFSEARDAIFVDEHFLKKSLDWMMRRQNEDGSFSDFGQVLDRTVQGNTAGPALTAGVLMALLENRHVSGEDACLESGSCYNFYRWNNATQKARKNLEAALDLKQTQFDLSVMTYALSLAKSKKAKKALRKLNKFAHHEGGLVYWSENATVSLPFLKSWMPPRVQSRPIDIIVTSFAILSHVEQDRLAWKNTLPAIRWLTTQRNSRGGFSSSQDTTVALRALSAYSTKSQSKKNGETKLKIKVTSDDSLRSEFIFNVDSGNALTLQIKEFFGTPSKVEITTKGSGVALVEVDYTFNINHELSVPSFDVSTVLLDDQLNQFNLMICTKWLWNRQTGMVVQEIGIPSGFEPDLSSLGQVAGLKRAERKGNLINVYFDEITKTSLCYSVLMSRTAKVAKTERTFVRTYDYYEPANQATVFYQPRKLKDATICDVCAKCC